MSDFEKLKEGHLKQVETRVEERTGDPAISSLIWATPDGDKMIAYLARVSNSKATPDMPSERLIGFLLRNHHWSPFAMANLCVEINTTRDISAQILRHKSADFQEFSTRYAEVEELLDIKECRFQDDANRQNSFEATPEQRAIVKMWDALVSTTSEDAKKAYQHVLSRGIAKETARCILPIGLMPTKLYMNGTVRTWIHYLTERTKPGVQKEHRAVALAAQAVFAREYPATFAAMQVHNREERQKEFLYKLLINDELEDIIETAADRIMDQDTTVGDIARAGATRILEMVDDIE